MDRSELLEFHKDLCEQARGIMERKNHDYTGDTSSPFANFEACERVGICSTEKGFLVRIMDKMKRLNTFVDNGELKVDDEPFHDACLDVLNYMVLFAAYQEDQEENSKYKSDAVNESPGGTT